MSVLQQQPHEALLLVHRECHQCAKRSPQVSAAKLVVIGMVGVG